MKYPINNYYYCKIFLFAATKQTSTSHDQFASLESQIICLWESRSPGPLTSTNWILCAFGKRQPYTYTTQTACHIVNIYTLHGSVCFHSGSVIPYMYLHQDSRALGQAAHQQTACNIYRTAGIPGPGDTLPYRHQGSRVDEYLVKVDTHWLVMVVRPLHPLWKETAPSLGLHTTVHSVCPSTLQSSLRSPINNSH